MQAYLWGLVQIVGSAEERRVESVVSEEAEQSVVAVEDFKNLLKGKQTVVKIQEQTLTIPNAYTQESKLVSKIIKGIKNKGENDVQFAALKAYPLFLSNNDVDTALSFYDDIQLDAHKMRANTYLAKFYSQKGHCSKADTYIRKLESGIKKSGWVLTKAKRTQNDMVAKEVIATLSEAKLLCESYISAIHVYGSYYPARLSSAGGLVRVYGDFAIALHDAKAEKEADFFLELGLEQARQEGIEKPKLIFAHAIYNYIATERLDKAYELYKNKINNEPQYKFQTIDAFFAGELAKVGKFDEALGLMEDSLISNWELKVLIEEAAIQLSNDDFYKLLKRIESILSKKSYRNFHVPLLIEHLYELGKEDEAKRLLNEMYTYLDYLQANDKSSVRTLINIMSKAHVKMSKTEELQTLFPDEAIAKPGMYSRAYAALYANYIATNQDAKRQEVEKLFSQYKASSLEVDTARYYMTEKDFVKAEAMLDQAAASRAENTWIPLFHAKNGASEAYRFHRHNMRAFRDYRERFD